jgi:hypothetical protein
MATRVDELYDEDFHAWAMGQADALRRLADLRPNVGIDFAHLIEEVEDLARAERNAVRSQLRRIIEHCLKLEYSPAAEPRLGRKASIDDARHEIADRLTPRIRRDLEHDLPNLFAQARRITAKTLAAVGEPQAAGALPPAIPYRLDDLLTDDWYPPSPEEIVDRRGARVAGPYSPARRCPRRSGVQGPGGCAPAPDPGPAQTGAAHHQLRPAQEQSVSCHHSFE